MGVFEESRCQTGAEAIGLAALPDGNVLPAFTPALIAMEGRDFRMAAPGGNKSPRSREAGQGGGGPRRGT